MNMLDLAQEVGLNPKRVSATRGGEYKSSCPNCKAGEDRFCIWPNVGTIGKYWCRKCDCKGDAIQFCRDFLGLSYLEACKRLRIEFKNALLTKGYSPFKKRQFYPQDVKPVSEKWSDAAGAFIESSHEKLLRTPSAIDLLSRRGISLETVITFRLGWNPNTIYDNRAAWGLSLELNNRGKERTQWLPKGIVIPEFDVESPVRLKIRRTEWHAEDKLPKYAEVSGGLQRPSIYGNPMKPVVVMESELDAILTQQFASDLCCCLALGGVGKRPDKQLHEFLTKAPLILLALDYDEAGKKEYPFWMSIYPNLRPWPASKGKSPGDAHQLFNVDLRRWVLEGCCNGS
jgi:DNA primase